jgi:hypothetical protein
MTQNSHDQSFVRPGQDSLPKSEDKHDIELIAREMEQNEILSMSKIRLGKAEPRYQQSIRRKGMEKSGFAEPWCTTQQQVCRKDKPVR